MFLPKLSNQEIGCYHSKTATPQLEADLSGSINPKPGPAGTDDISQELVELKAKQDSLRQILRQVGEQFLALAQSSASSASMAGRDTG